MKSREDVIKGLECCIDYECNVCHYGDDGGAEDGCCSYELKKDALALLKAQKPIEPEPKEVIYDDEHRSVYCPSCDNRLAGLTYSGAVALETEETPNYCWMCGQVVKW